jgi:hypothetical protein
MRYYRSDSDDLIHHGEPFPLAATLAAPYSGATLFAIILARHSQLSSDGEIFPFGQNDAVLCRCGQAQIDCPYYREVADHMLRADGTTWDPALFAPYPAYSQFAFVDRTLGRFWSNGVMRRAQHCLRSMIPGCARQDQIFLDAHVRFMENSLRLRQARVYVDGSKSVRRALLFAGCPQVRLKVIHLVRDGRGFCFSYLKNHNLPRTELARAARAWLRSIETVDRLKARLPGVAVLSVRYEDLCRALPITIRRVCKFLDVPYEPALESPDTRPCHVMGNRMRMTFSGQIEECLRWQREFVPAEIAFLNRSLRESLERFDYSMRPLSPVTMTAPIRTAG